MPDSKLQSRGRGRPSKLTHQLVDELCDAIRDGLTFELACDNVGIDRSLFYQWQREEFPKSASQKLRAYFLHNVKKAETELARSALQGIREHGSSEDVPGQWQALAWLVERRYRNAYGRQVHEHTGPDGGPVQVAISTIEVVAPEDDHE